MTSLRIAFAGTPAFALPALRALLASRHRVVGVLTQPDRPAGRGRELRASPVKLLAAAQPGLPIAQPATLKTPEGRAILHEWSPDLLVVVAYGLILPQAVLDRPRLGCLNIHGSLLPRWRGAAPIQRAILAGDAETGVCIMQTGSGSRHRAGADRAPASHRHPRHGRRSARRVVRARRVRAARGHRRAGGRDGRAAHAARRGRDLCQQAGEIRGRGRLVEGRDGDRSPRAGLQSLAHRGDPVRRRVAAHPARAHRAQFAATTPRRAPC